MTRIERHPSRITFEANTPRDGMVRVAALDADGVEIMMMDLPRPVARQMRQGLRKAMQYTGPYEKPHE